ncbi:MAG: hypothetical protein Q4E37_06105 [Tissierellia bacterium]|nr:hypothetical protein [Tissierellia bacterium]
MKKEDLEPSQEEIQARKKKLYLITGLFLLFAVVAFLSPRYRGHANLVGGLVFILLGLMALRGTKEERLIKNLREEKAKKAELEELRRQLRK